jgi:hypothetical protein
LSTILKALRRLEEEKAVAEEARPLREQIASPPRETERPRRSGWLAAGGALVLGVATGGALIWWLFGNPSAAPVVAAAAPAAAAPQPAAPAPVPVAAPPPAAVPGPPEQAFSSDVQTVDRPEALPILADSDPIQPGPQQPKPGSVRPVETSAAAERARQAALAEYNAAERAQRGLPPEVAQPSPPQPATPVPVVAAQNVDIQPAPPALAPAPAPAQLPVAQGARPEPEVVAAQAAPEPKPAAKPAARRAAPKAAPAPAAKPAAPPPTPEIAVSVEKTQWHPMADRRIAWLRVPGDSAPRRVVEGDVVDGLLISAIEPSGVVFERDGEKIRRPLGK